ncbi:hypothetical protein E2562_032095 [Oryza meyeriana var. granulata]|uniref:Uncharacterized protein n=1 Tax=Oryza meyeriana var. granulata TaxID=110450 RepID=A0A6G1CJ38_9ORYZ|nr:hypothetical protein E2562_032095 [Oryza meyeriana var. granulata]
MPPSQAISIASSSSSSFVVASPPSPPPPPHHPPLASPPATPPTTTPSFSSVGPDAVATKDLHPVPLSSLHLRLFLPDPQQSAALVATAANPLLRRNSFPQTNDGAPRPGKSSPAAPAQASTVSRPPPRHATVGTCRPRGPGGGCR